MAPRLYPEAGPGNRPFPERSRVSTG